MKKARHYARGKMIDQRLTFNKTPMPIVMLKGLTCIAYPLFFVLVKIAHYIDRPYTIGTFDSSKRR